MYFIPLKEKCTLVQSNNKKQEVDWVAEQAGSITGFKIKWKAKTNTKLPITFTKNYQAEPKIIDRSNFRDFVL